ncbi:MAG: HAMP domain-containing sensor histidine kinase [Myxococcota bacterium]
MNRRTQLLLGIIGTVGVTLALAWITVQALVIRPAIGERERARTQQVLDAAELMREGMSKPEIEASRGIDLRVYLGQPDEPPPGDAWVRNETARGTTWKRSGGKYEIAAWTGRTWVVIEEDLPYGTTFALALIGGGIPIILLMFGLSRRANRHQERAEESLARIAEGNLAERLDEHAGNREVRRVASAVNRMAEQLQSLIEAERQQMAGLSHELRTPLTRIRLELELARREGAPSKRLDRVEQDIEVFDAMLTEMLDLSRLRMVGPRALNREPVDLHRLAQDVVAQGWSDVDVRGTGTANADANLVARLLRNLLRNSVEHAPSSQRWIEVANDTLRVGDDGPGIAEDRHATVLDPFVRGAASDGHGLGLAIVTEIAALHEGAVSLSAPPGLVVTVSLGPSPAHDG